MVRIGITYRPKNDIFYSGANQTALLLGELCMSFGYEVVQVDPTNSDPSGWPGAVNLYQTKDLDVIIDVDGLIAPEERTRCAKRSIVFLRTFLQFTEMDSIVYIETPYVRRSFAGVQEVWCWDLLNPLKTIASIQTMIPCPIRRVPFIWSPAMAETYLKGRTISFVNGHPLSVHVAEKNVENTSSSVIPLVAIKELVQSHVVQATYMVHNMEVIKDNKFLKENVFDNIEIDKLPVTILPKAPFHEWVSEENPVLFSHSRFTPLRIGLLNALWMGLPVIHNSPVLRDLHPKLKELYYHGNSLVDMRVAFQQLSLHLDAFAMSIDSIRGAIVSAYGIPIRHSEWATVLSEVLAKSIDVSLITPITNTVYPVYKEVPNTAVVHTDEWIVAFSDMWPGFNYDSNFIMDSLRHEVSGTIKGMKYESTVRPHVVIFGPYSEEWKSIPKDIPKVYFSAENWTAPSDPSVVLHLTSKREESDQWMHIPTWMTFIDWFTDKVGLPETCVDNPIRLPLYFAMNTHPIGFKERTQFCAFVVSNPICEFRNQTFQAVDQYKQVDSGGALYNNIGGQLALKYPGGGCGDISKHHFFSHHQFTISFENSQSPGYITEKVLHAKMAGCVPLYWGDANTDTDFAPNSFINLSGTTDPSMVVEVIKKLEANPDMCAAIARTPILNAEKRDRALSIISRMSQALLRIMGYRTTLKAIDGVENTYVINLDTRPDRWEKLMVAEPYLEPLVERVSGVNGKTLTMDATIFRLFQENEFQWKKSIIGCNLSHISVWKKIAEAKKDGWYLVLEDDVRFQSNWINEWRKCLRSIPADADLLYLGGVLPPNKAVLPLVSDNANEHWSYIKPNTLFSPVPAEVFHFCAYSYLLKPSGAQKIMKYMMDSDKRSFTVSDHLLGHPSVGLKKYFTRPLLSYCFQEEDPVYVNSQFNDLHREDKFDSDIWNNKECFTEAELAPFRNATFVPSTLDTTAPMLERIEEERTPRSDAEDTRPITMYYHGESDKPYVPYEKLWLEDMFQHPIIFTNVEGIEIYPESWFVVQRPYVNKLIELFITLEQHHIPFHVLHLSDEFGTDDLSFYQLSMCKTVIRNYPRYDMSWPSHVHVIPLGYHVRAIHGSPTKSWNQRELAWSFHGTDWFDRSTQLGMFTKFVPYSCHLQPNWNHPTATKEKPYLSLLGNSKYCPILKGQHAETFRLYEALEAGTLPITVLTDKNYLQWIEDHLHLSSFYDWTNPEKMLGELLGSEEIRIAVHQQWKAWKERVRAICCQAVTPYLSRSFE
jgi:GR25 family glycosyltransferase involved in LPS biosynthesis